MAPRTHRRIHRRRPFRFLTELVLASALLMLMLAFRFHLEADPYRFHVVGQFCYMPIFTEMPQTVQTWKPLPPVHHLSGLTAGR